MTRDKPAATVVVGLGKTGTSVARFLHRRSVPFIAADSRVFPPGRDEFKRLYPQVEVCIGDFDERLFLGAAEVVLSPGVPLKTPAVQRALAAGISVVGDVELFARTLGGGKSVVAVTGSNGKSTVTTLLAEMATRAGIKTVAGGNLGPPALDLIADDGDAELYVLELSSFQLETTYSLKPAASVVLNVSEDHLDRYDSFNEYVKAKQRIHRGSRSVVLNREDRHRLEIPSSSRVVSFGLDVGGAGQFGVVQTAAGPAVAFDGEAWIARTELGYLPGDSGMLNAQAALALGHVVGLPRAAMIETLKRFKGLPHRRRTIAEFDGVVWIDDSKATNVAAAAAALADLDRPCVWIAGGDAKGQDFSPLRKAVGDRVHVAILIGRAAAQLAAAIKGTGCTVVFVGNLESAVVEARAVAHKGDCVLLSPACSSLDAFSSYVERGERFARAIEELQT